MKDPIKDQQKLYALEQEYRANLKKDASLRVLKKILVAIRKLKTGETVVKNGNQASRHRP